MSRRPGIGKRDLPDRPGEIFVHRNIASLVVHTDVNMLPVLQYAVEVLKVKHVIVCGHCGCGGVAAAMSDKQFGLIANRLTSIKDVMRLHETEPGMSKDEEKRFKPMVALNVTEQVMNLAKASVIQNAMKTEDAPELHGLVYDIREGLLIDLKINTTDSGRYRRIYEPNATPS